ncbi:CaiB/BaiF CoA transferase family protein [Mycobacterium sp. NPDC003449]
MVSGPLKGVRVVDSSIIMAGPFATMILAEQGADVVKVEGRDGDPSRWQMGRSEHTIFPLAFNTNRAKRSLAVNLKHPKGVEIVQRLVSEADVFVENFRAGVADRLGLGYAELSKVNSRLIYVRVNGLGRQGAGSSRRVYDPVAQALAGVCAVQRDEQSPRLMKTLLADKITPTLLAQAITAALYEREKSGQGQFLEQSMLHSVVWWMWPDMMANRTYTADDATVCESNVYDRQARPIYATSDGHVLAVMYSDLEWRELCRGLGRGDLADDERFATTDARAANRIAMESILTDEFAKGSTSEWNRRLSQTDAAFAVVNTPDTLLHDPQILANDVYTQFDDPVLGQVRAPTPFARFDRTPAETAVSPQIGQHSRVILQELGYALRDISQLQRLGVIG